MAVQEFLFFIYLRLTTILNINSTKIKTLNRFALFNLLTKSLNKKLYEHNTYKHCEHPCG
jgi:hypothetical protein